MRKLLASLLVLAVLGVVAAEALAATRSVRVGDNFFVVRGKPRTITVKKGTKLTWRFRASSLHNVDVHRGPMHFRSRLMRHGRFSKRLTKPGTYVIYCDVHGSSMRMTIRVRR